MKIFKRKPKGIFIIKKPRCASKEETKLMENAMTKINSLYAMMIPETWEIKYIKK